MSFDLEVGAILKMLGSVVLRQRGLSLHAKIEHYAIDSRECKQKSLFFALVGAKVDGHRFIRQASIRGAIVAIVSDPSIFVDATLDQDIGLILVEDVTKALHLLAKNVFVQRAIPVIAITGSMGKTTTKEFLFSLLSRSYVVAKTVGNQNTQLTLPLTLLNLKGLYDWAVLEMSMSQRGHIEKLVDMAPPHTAVITRIAPAGMEGFYGGLNNIARAKGEIFSHPMTQEKVMSAQAATFSYLRKQGGKEAFIYGRQSERDRQHLHSTMQEVGEAVVITDHLGEKSPLLFPAFKAAHLRENLLGAVTVARLKGVPWSCIEEVVPILQPVSLRFALVEKEGITFVQDCYNANPDSMQAAIESTPNPQGRGRKIAVLGSMVDLGKKSRMYHEHVGAHAAKHFDVLLCIGKEAKLFAKSFEREGKFAAHYGDLESLRLALYGLLKAEDVVLIKGSNGLKLWELL